ncbi:MAG: peptidyl-prolyl cis-trans isomerase [Planctomycetota bacterium]|nr:peptidyl-prolyl cis-trans isomerase [Planctomycetota bacterium]
MKRLIAILTIVLVTFAASNASAENNAILAVYDGKALTFADVRPLYEYQVYSMEMRLVAKYRPNPVPKAARDAFQEQCNEMLASITRMEIFNRLVIEHGRKNGMVPLSETTEARIKMRVNSILESQQETQMWIKFVKAAGIDPVEVRNFLMRRETARYVGSRSIGKPDMISPREIREYYEANKDNWYREESVTIRIMTLPFSEYGGGLKTEKLATELAQKVAGGESFAKLVHEYSKDSYAKKGGLYGDFNTDQLNAVFRSVVEKMTEGDVSEPIVLRSSVRLLYLEKKTPEGVQPLEDVRMEIKKKLEIDAMRARQEEWTKKLYMDAVVRYVHPTIMAIAKKMDAQDQLSSDEPVERNATDENGSEKPDEDKPEDTW